MSSSWLHEKEAQHGAAAWRRRPEERRHQGGEREEDGASWVYVNLIGLKNKESPHGQFNCYKWMMKI
jgi:hypothetical protein